MPCDRLLADFEFGSNRPAARDPLIRHFLRSSSAAPAGD
jgi:hypothetical protein